ncbi:anthranilate synthase component I family protein [Paenibacillus sp. SYP-B3998]|uniref:Anthranilate synthase component I family protein n=1 Tax=Paenibacillus sp. SYP-B3998 TaxID=2678564 RepID=A0A6G4A5K2_9BACL|nr:anthranilate synthase component I family protein [Paenibacillus sp. SYP-B3998]NEW09568.1 anthranilate synthase component I family protein [Paenibacillus sp. SYP-B3998]
MILTTLEQWRSWSSAYTMLPYVIKLGLADDRIASWHEAWNQASPNSFLLESGKGGRYTCWGLHPITTIHGVGMQAEISGRDRDHKSDVSHVQGKPLDVVKQWMAPYRSPKVEGAPKFLGGCVGYWSYDVIRTIEKLPELAANDLPIPDYSFAMYDQVWTLDHVEKSLFISVHIPLARNSVDDAYLEQLYERAHQKAEAMLDKWQAIRSGNWPGVGPDRVGFHDQLAREHLHIEVERIEGIKPAFDKADYMDAVERIQTYISEGDVFQVNLSVRQSRKLNTTPEEIYEALRVVNPSPYMGLLRFADFALVSGSPELLVQLEDGVLRTRPIAGTRPRGKDEQDDLRLAGELIHNDKERAEHVMLVDLERNDLGRISKYGSVQVKDFMVIEYYSHVMHIVSEVVGELAEGKDAYDVIAATFPGGTITGAPKIRTMEIIEELEPVRRGPYTGSMGWIDYNGNMEFNIIIRTLVAVQGMGHIQAGAGIVIDSIPEREYVESLNKAKAMWKAIEFSERSMSRA